MALAEMLTAGSGAAMFPKRKKPAGDQGAIDFSPLCDMTFQLLAFFIMTVKLANQETVDVPTISHGTGVELDTAMVFTMLASADAKGDPRIILGNGAEGKSVTLEEARNAIEASVRQGKPNIIIKAEKTTTAGAVQKLSRIVAAVNGAELFIGVADTD
jgi:biopolymer transport protein ExbD